jgi:hypothetical protein
MGDLWVLGFQTCQTRSTVRTFELLSDVGHLTVDPLLLQLANPTCSKIRDVLHQSSQYLGDLIIASRPTWVNPLIEVDILTRAF